MWIIKCEMSSVVYVNPRGSQIVHKMTLKHIYSANQEAGLCMEASQNFFSENNSDFSMDPCSCGESVMSHSREL